MRLCLAKLNWLVVLASCVIVLAIVVLPASASPSILGSCTFDQQGAGYRSLNPPVLSIIVTPQWHVLDAVLFANTPLVASVGKTIWLTSNIDSPDYTKAVGYLTNGSDDLVVAQSTAGGIGNTEQKEFFGGTGGPDFKGYTITGLGLRINSATAASPGSNPNGDGLWTDYSYNATFLVEGYAVPEPGSIVVVLCVVGGIGGVAWRRKAV